MKCLWSLVALLPIVLCGCGGDASILLENHTDVYVHGTTGGEQFSLYPGDHCTRTVQVGSFWSSSSDITTAAYLHETESASSPVAHKLSRTDKIKKDDEFKIEITYLFNTYNIEARLSESQSSILAP